jgi:GNAT superfamily N-acetyltransferase
MAFGEGNGPLFLGPKFTPTMSGMMREIEDAAGCPSGIKVILASDSSDFAARSDKLLAAQWPEFALHVPSERGRWIRLSAELSRYQFLLVTDGDQLLGAGFSGPLAWDGITFPEEGWDWCIAQIFADLDAGREPTALAALSITLSDSARGQGLADVMLRVMHQLALRSGVSDLIAAVRPTGKPRYPLLPMADYAAARNADGQVLDPWLRAHVRVGGRIAGVCERAMSIPASVGEWERWSGLPMPLSGDYVVPGGLVPVRVDLDLGRASYVEPGVWVHHRLRGASPGDG